MSHADKVDDVVSTEVQQHHTGALSLAIIEKGDIATAQGYGFTDQGGKATWSVQDGVLVGIGGMGHIYTDATCSDFEAKGMFRVTSQGATPNSGFYFRANPPADNPNDFPQGYEAQICNHGDGHTGRLWRPGKPTGKATELLSKDGEWFSYRIRAVGKHIQFWINDKLVMTYNDAEYKTGHLIVAVDGEGG